MSLDTPEQIGTNRQLFVDGFWIDKSIDVQEIFHKPVKENATMDSVRVEIQDSKGRPVPELSMADSPVMLGEDIDGISHWNSNDDLGRWQVKRYRCALP